jgi:hypothetical protein
MVLAVGWKALGAARPGRVRSCVPNTPGGARPEHVTQRRPRAQRAVADHQPRLVEAAVLEIAHERGPGLGALAVAVLDGEQLLGPVLADADHDQQAEPVVLAQAHRDAHRRRNR